MREARLDRGVAPAQRIVLGVADLRRVLLMVEAIVVGDLLRQLRKFGGGVLFRRVIASTAAAVCGRGLRRCAAHTAAPSRSSAAARAASVTVSPASMRAISSRRCGASS